MIGKLRFLALVLMLCATVNSIIAIDIVPVDVVEAREIGLSDSDDTKSVVEVKWQTTQQNYKFFNVMLEIKYADGAILIFDEQVSNQSRSTQIEVPALHIYRNKRAAIIKEIKAFVTTEIY